MTYALLVWMATAPAPSSATMQCERLTVIVNVSDDGEPKAALEAAKTGGYPALQGADARR